MDKIKLVQDLIQYVSVYPGSSNQEEQGQLGDFLKWAISAHEAHHQMVPERELRGELTENAVNPAIGESEEVEISRLVVCMYRYAKSYMKIALEGQTLQTADEFAYLATLLTRQGMGKSELIQMNIQEKTTGMEIIRRLLVSGLIYQYDNPEDKRSKCVALTDAGRRAFFESLGKMYNVSMVVGGNLNSAEKKTLLNLLRKLDHHHHEIYTESKQREMLDAIPQAPIPSPFS